MNQTLLGDADDPATSLSAGGESRETAFRISVGTFDGPLDLLLHLVRERRLDVATVPLAVVTRQYLDHVAAMEALDLEIAAEYLHIAATLLFLKSKSLLPPVPGTFLTDDDLTPEEAEEELRRRLVAHSFYGTAAKALRLLGEEADVYYFRDGGAPGVVLVQEYRLSLDRLAAALLTALRAAKPETRVIVRPRVTLAARIEAVAQRVNAHGSITFGALCAGLNRAEIVVTFLAVLELIRQARIAYRQNDSHDVLVLLPYEPMVLHEHIAAE